MQIKIDSEKLTLGDREILKADLSDNNRTYVNRVEVLLKNMSELDLQRSELEVLLNAYSNTLEKSLTPEVEEVN
ncbi:MAG: hypothetical protein ACO23H_14145 [Alphaproteobacteria bacterium]